MTQNAQIDSTLLADLKPLYIPESTPFVPETNGWLFLAVIGVVILATIIIVVVKKHRARRYRRLAVSVLDTLAADADSGRAADVIRESSEILKRVAMTSFGRARVAALMGEDWIDFLRSKYQKIDLVTFDLLTSGQYKHTEKLEKTDKTQLSTFITDIKNWIKYHRV